jgi:hypothetical protein
MLEIWQLLSDNLSSNQIPTNEQALSTSWTHWSQASLNMDASRLHGSSGPRRRRIVEYQEPVTNRLMIGFLGLSCSHAVVVKIPSTPALRGIVRKDLPLSVRFKNQHRVVLRFTATKNNFT